MQRTVYAALLFVLLPGQILLGDNWHRWRGPDQNGVAAGSGFPVTWNETDGITWKVKIPGWGTSTPVISGDRIFLTCEKDGQNGLVCLDRDGNQLWETTFGKSAGRKNRKASGANPSPVTDGNHVFVYYRSGDVACVDFDGKTVWLKNLQTEFGPDRLWWDLGSSPALTSNAVVLAVMHQGPSYVVALDKESGSVLWKTPRELDAPGESRDSYTTPVLFQDGDRELVAMVGADHVTAYDVNSGDEVWRVSGLNPGGRGNFRLIASPAPSDDVLVVPFARGASLMAVRFGGSGDITDSHVAWSIDMPGPDVPTPVTHDGKVYICGDRGTVTCLDASSGEEVWVEELPRSRYAFSSSPVIADGHLYLTRENGMTYVLRLDSKPELVASNFVRENTYATPVFLDNSLFLRTSDYLFRIDRQP